VLDVNKEWAFGETPLLLAVERNDVEITKLLLDYPDVQVNAKNEVNGHTPLHGDN
jgi:ankyrin repeat protein